MKKRGSGRLKILWKLQKVHYLSIIFDNKLNKFIHKHMESWEGYIGKLIKTVVEQYIMLFLNKSCL